MKLQPSSILFRILQLLMVSFVTASLYVLLLSFDPNPTESPTHFSFWENIIWIPLTFTILFLPFVFSIGCVTFILKAIIQRILSVKHIIFDIIFYVSVSIIVIPILPNMITDASTTTGYQFFINPYYLLPFTGALILIFSDNINKKKSGI